MDTAADGRHPSLPEATLAVEISNLDSLPATRLIPPGPLTEDDLDYVLAQTGWPEELRPSAKRVARCESTWNSLATNGQYRGLFQLGPLWFDYTEHDPDSWADPFVNARVAYLVVEYDLSRGHPPFNQWECQP